MSEVKIRISADSKEAEKGFKTVSQALSSLNKDVFNFSSVAKNAFSSFLGNLSANAVSSAFGALKNGFSSGISLAQEFTTLAGVQEDAVNKLNVSLAQTGRFTQESSRSIQEFASRLQSTSRFGDEVILKNAALIQSLGKLDEQGLKRATQAAADLASGTGKSFEEVSRTIAKASTGQVQVFRELGINVENTGDTVRDFNNALTILEQRFGGSAAASINTFAGAQAQANNVIGDFKEVLGATITESPVFISAVKGVTDAFTSLIKLVQDNKEGIQGFVSGGIDLAISGIGKLGESIGFFLDISSGFKSFFAETVDLALAATENVFKFTSEVNKLVAQATDFLGLSDDATASVQENQKKQLSIISKAREANEQKTLEEIAANEKIKESALGVTQTIQDAIRSRIDAEKTGLAESQAIQLEKINQDALNREVASQAEKDFRAAFNEEFLQEQRDLLGTATADQNAFNLQKLANEGQFNKALLELQKQRETAQRASFLGVVRFEEQTQRERVQNLQSAFGQIASLQSSGSATLFAIGKAAAISTATIDGIAAVQKALASAPPPLNFALAGLVGAAQAANLARISSTKPPTGAFDGALVEQGSIFSDSQPFMLSKGEIVAPRRDFDDVVEGTARQRGFVKREELEEGQASEPVTINIQGDIFGEETFIDRLAQKLLDAQRTRNVRLV